VTEEVPLRITPDMLLSRRLDFERQMRRLPPVTVSLLGAVIVIFLAEAAAQAPNSLDTLVGFGALTRASVAAGDYWRLVTATFLHGGVDHLVGNGIALLILGMVCEHAFGRRQYFALYVLAGVAGSVVSVLTSPGPSVGASGAIFGLQGAAIVLFRRHRDRLLVRNRRIGFVMLVWAVYSIAGGIVTPYIDNGAHIGGALAGALIARRLHPVVLDPLPDARARAVRGAVWLAAALVAYGALGLLWSLAR
jgi:rhomboid protease GluP